jgi:D-beta-D-heptose 7-phosphate kinase/D-beta-D-heptose 1-phosphate adenosyltransferase
LRRDVSSSAKTSSKIRIGSEPSLFKRLNEPIRSEIAIDQDGSVCETIELFHNKIKSLDPESEIIFTKGGDRFANEIPEKLVCDSLGIKIVDGLGLKTHNSSDMINKK